MSIHQILFSAIAPDFTPNAVNWTDLSATNPILATDTTNTQTIDGIAIPIVIRFTDSLDDFATIGASYSKNGGSFVSFDNFTLLTINSGDTLAFKAFASITAQGTISVINDTAGGVVLDTINYSLFVA